MLSHLLAIYCIMLYDHEITNIMYCSNKAALSSAIFGVQYHTGSTQTAQAIDKAVTDVFSSSNGARSGVAKVGSAESADLSRLKTKTTKWYVRPAKSQISPDQPGHPPSLIRVFAVRSMGS